MHLIYIDDSQDQDTRFYVFSALAIPAERWRAAFAEIRDFRRLIRDSDGIYVTKELHAWKFVSGRGRISQRIVTKARRCSIFRQTLALLARQQDSLSLFNVALAYRQDWAFERLLNRINRTMQAWGSHALLICDAGKEAEYTRLVRRMGVHNPIPSAYGVWLDTGAATRNIPIERIVEDPFFKPSERSYFIQMADFCAYALLRRERPIASKSAYGLDSAFNLLAPICVTAANRRDPLGIIR
jgi:uncharacterized protein DUF3800